MPQPASAIARERYLRLLVMGPAKIGKSTSIISTCPKPAYVINCDDQGALQPAARRTQEFEWDLVHDSNDMEDAIQTAREGVKDERYKTIILDTLSAFASRLEVTLLEASDSGRGPDGRRAWPEYERRLRNIIERLFMLDAHVIVITHYIDVGGNEVEGQLARSGKGIVPLLGGKARGTVPMLFQDVVYMDKRKVDGEMKRVFVANEEGVWGPGCRNLEGTLELEADIGLLMEAMNELAKGKHSQKRRNKERQ